MPKPDDTIYQLRNEYVPSVYITHYSQITIIRVENFTRHGAREKASNAPVETIILLAVTGQAAGGDGKRGGGGEEGPRRFRVVIGDTQWVTNLFVGEVIDTDRHDRTPKGQIVQRAKLLDASLSLGLVVVTKIAHAEITAPAIGILFRPPLIMRKEKKGGAKGEGKPTAEEIRERAVRPHRKYEWLKANS